VRPGRIQVGSAAAARITDNALRLHILPRLGERQLGALRGSDVQACVKACVKACSEQLGAGSVRNVCEILARLLPGASSWWALRAGLVVGKGAGVGPGPQPGRWQAQTPALVAISGPGLRCRRGCRRWPAPPVGH
jgi:hypothetical protein